MEERLPADSLRCKKLFLPLLAIILLLFSFKSYAQHSVARQWNEALLHAIRKDYARPTVHARNLWHTSIVLYDAWAIYTPAARPFFLGDTVGDYYCPFNGISIPAQVKKAQEETMSYAAYRLLKYRFQNSPGAISSLAYMDSLFMHLGYNAADTATNYSSGSAAALGNYLAREIISFGLQDNSNEQNGYVNISYTPKNVGMAPIVPGNPNITDPNRWQPLTLNVYIDQSGNVIPISTPAFLSPEWGAVVPFALDSTERTVYNRNGQDYPIYHAPPIPPQIDTINGGMSTENYKWGFRMVSKWSSHMDTADGVMWDISPASIGNIQSFPRSMDSLKYFYNEDNGGDYGMGHSMNPATGMPYAPQMVPRGDYARVLAEFWADGPDSETPPGHWFALLNYVTDHPMQVKKWRGQGPALDDLEWDVKTYFTMAGAVHDAAVTAWGLKGWYDYIRPISALRYLGDQGQSSDSTLPNYHKNGIELDSGFVELVDSSDVLVGANYENLYKIKVRAWAGPDSVSNPATDMAGVSWILLENWWPYQRPSFVTPPFAGYVSGHSTFSRAAAEVMTGITGDEYFPGGMGQFLAKKNKFLVFEEGPSRDITLQWATYRDASDQCSLSRIWGGIHPPADDIPGRLIGIEVGNDAFNLARTYWENGIPDVTLISTNTDMVNDTLAGKGRFRISVAFDSFMDTTQLPLISFPVENPLSKTLKMDSIDSKWMNEYTYIAHYDVNDSNETLLNIDIRVSGAKATDGSTQSVYNSPDRFHIDMENPVLALNISPMLVMDNHVGQGSSIVSLNYSEPMDTSVAPAIQFPGQNPLLKSFTVNTGNTLWLDSTTYQFTFDVADSNETLGAIDVELSLGKDINGNDFSTTVFSNAFRLDTENPFVISAIPSHDTIMYKDIKGLFNLTLNYSEAMDTNYIPNLSFPVENPLATTLTYTPFKSYWQNASTFTASYTIDTALVTLWDIDVAGEWTYDFSGNAQLAHLQPDVFSINMIRPSGVGLEDISWFSDVRLYPNPVRQGDQVKLELVAPGENLTVTVYDIQGREVQRLKFDSTPGENYLADLSMTGFEAGTYMVRLKSGWVQEYTKLIIIP